MQKVLESILCPNCERKLRPPFKVCQEEHIVCPNCEQHQNNTTGAPEGDENCSGKVFSIPILNIMFRNMLDNCQFDCGFRGNLLELDQHEQNCRTKTREEKCPKCNTSTTEAITEARNYTLQKLLQNLDLNKKYNNDKDSIMQIDKNCQNCSQENTECVVAGCPWTGSYLEVLTHWRDQHSNWLKLNRSTFTCGWWYMYLYTISGQNFVFTYTYDEENYFFSVHHLTYNESSEFFFALEFTHPHTYEFIAFSRHCIASPAGDTKNREYLENSSNVCKLSMQWFDDVILDSNGQFQVSLNIFRKS